MPPEGREALTRRIFQIPLLFFCSLMSLSFYLGIHQKQLMSIPLQSKYKLFKKLFKKKIPFSLFFNCSSVGTLKQAPSLLLHILAYRRANPQFL